MKLESIGCSVYRIKFPWGTDANDYALNHGGEALKKAVRDALWHSSNASESMSCAPSLIEKAAKEAELPLAAAPQEVAKKENISGEVETNEPPESKLSHGGENLRGSEEVWTEAKLKPVGGDPQVGGSTHYYEFVVGERVYRVGGCQNLVICEVKQFLEHKKVARCRALPRS